MYIYNDLATAWAKGKTGYCSEDVSLQWTTNPWIIGESESELKRAITTNIPLSSIKGRNGAAMALLNAWARPKWSVVMWAKGTATLYCHDECLESSFKALRDHLSATLEVTTPETQGRVGQTYYGRTYYGGFSVSPVIPTYTPCDSTEKRYELKFGFDMPSFFGRGMMRKTIAQYLDVDDEARDKLLAAMQRRNKFRVTIKNHHDLPTMEEIF